MKLFKYFIASLALASVLLPTTMQGQTVTIQQSDAVADIKTNIEAALASNDVIVTGSKTGVTEALAITIPNGKTIEWKANYSGAVGDITNSGVIVLSGNGGTFEVATGGKIENTSTFQYLNVIVAPESSDNVTIRVSGGAVEVTGSGNTGGGAAINNEFGPVEVTAGSVIGNYEAIRTNKGNVTVSGGTVQGDYRGIFCVSDVPVEVKVTGGTVTAVGEGVYLNQGTITVSGTGTVTATGDGTAQKLGWAVETNNGDVTISEDAEITSGHIAIYNVNGKVTVSGNSKVTATDYAIVALTDDVTISDKVMIESDNTGIYDSGGNITINGGTLKATNWAINAKEKSATITVNGGTIAGGTGGISVEMGNVIVNGGSITSVSPQPQNSAGKNVYLNTLTIGGTAQTDKPVTGGSIGVTNFDAMEYDATLHPTLSGYGIYDVKTDNAGKVYFWFPASGNNGADAEEIIVNANSSPDYKNTYTRKPDTENTYTLRLNYAVRTVEQVGGVSNEENTTALKITFNSPFPGLTAGDITVTDLDGSVTTGSLTDVNGDGSEYLLAVTTTVQGYITVFAPGKDETAFGPNDSEVVEVYKDNRPIAVKHRIHLAGDTTSMPVCGQFVFTFPEKMDTATVRTVKLWKSWNADTIKLTGSFLDDSVTFIVDYCRLDFRTDYTLELSDFHCKKKLQVHIYEHTFHFVTQNYPPPPAIVRFITLPAVSGAVMEPAAGVHRVWSGHDFTFTLTPPAGMIPHVSTDRLLGGAHETLKEAQDVNCCYTYVIRDVRENTTVSITFAVGNENVTGAASLKVHPNSVPRGDLVRLEYGAPDNTKVRIYTVQGTLVSVQQLQNGQAMLTFPPVAGVYIVRVGNATAKVVVK